MGCMVTNVYCSHITTRKSDKKIDTYRQVGMDPQNCSLVAQILSPSSDIFLESFLNYTQCGRIVNAELVRGVSVCSRITKQYVTCPGD